MLARPLLRKASTITRIVGREIIDRCVTKKNRINTVDPLQPHSLSPSPSPYYFCSRGGPTVEADVYTSDGGMFRAAVPSGASTGIHEAVELRDGDKKRYNGKGVLKAVASVNDVFSAKLKGMDVTGQGKLDAAMIDLDGTPNKGKLGANAILAVSMAVAKAGAAANKLPLYQYIAHLAGKPTASACILPVPSFNVINGGEHAGNGLAFQEFMILPTGAQSFSEAMRMGCETYSALKTVLKKKYGQDSVNVGDEGGFAPNISDAEEGLNLLSTAIEAAGYTGRMVIGMDVAASEFIVEGTAPNSKYDVLKKKTPGGPGVKNGAEMLAMYQSFAKKYPIVSIEDPFEQVSGGERRRGGCCLCYLVLLLDAAA